MSSKRQRILVTGGGGFLGCNLVRGLIGDGHEVHVVGRAPHGAWRLAGLEGRYIAHASDLRDRAALARVVAACPPDVVYHLAMCGAFGSPQDRPAVLETNVVGLANLLECLDRTGYRRLVNVGTSAEYGRKTQPMHESNCPEPRTAYAVSKAAATLLCQAEAFQGRPICTVRLFSTYGPWDHPERLPLYVMRCCLEARRPRVTAGGLPRDFLYVGDAVEVLRLAAEHPKAVGQILNAGGGRQHTVRDMVETILSVAGGGLTADYVEGPLPADEPERYVADMCRTRSLLGWMPTTDLEAGVQRTWAWFRGFAAARAA